MKIPIVFKCLQYIQYLLHNSHNSRKLDIFFMTKTNLHGGGMIPWKRTPPHVDWSSSSHSNKQRTMAQTKYVKNPQKNIPNSATELISLNENTDDQYNAIIWSENLSNFASELNSHEPSNTASVYVLIILDNWTRKRREKAYLVEWCNKIQLRVEGREARRSWSKKLAYLYTRFDILVCCSMHTKSKNFWLKQCVYT